MKSKLIDKSQQNHVIFSHGNHDEWRAISIPVGCANPTWRRAVCDFFQKFYKFVGIWCGYDVYGNILPPRERICKEQRVSSDRSRSLSLSKYIHWYTPQTNKTAPQEWWLGGHSQKHTELFGMSHHGGINNDIDFHIFSHFANLTIANKMFL